LKETAAGPGFYYFKGAVYLPLAYGMSLLARMQLRAGLKSKYLFSIHNSFSLRAASMSTISDAIVKDHRELEQYYNEVVNSSDHDHQQRFGNQFTWELARHSVGEELIVYPAFEKYMGAKGKDMAEKDRKEHHRVSQLGGFPFF
jgi:hemerythrin HHE cation binding domain-containing protein